MNKLLRFATTASVLGIAGMVTSTPAQANPPLTEVERLGNQIHRLTGREPMSQVTAISQLSDVRPTDWAFTALQSLVERYNCIAGYPDRTYRGNRAMTRYEFAAGLNACLDKINEIIASGLADKVSKDDLAAIQKLQEEFAAELATLRGRVDTLEGKVATLEAQQFSTTTKLEGQAIFALAGATNENIVFQSRALLNFNTSFTGDDLLLTRLQAGSGGTAVTGTSGAFLSGLDYGAVPQNFALGVLRYDFKIGKDIDISVGPAMQAYDHIDANSYANNEAVDFSSTFFLNNPLHILVPSGAGIYAKYTPNRGPFSIGVLYMASNASQANPSPGIPPNGGLFGDNNQITAEFAYVPTDKDGNIPFALRLQYTRGHTSTAVANNLSTIPPVPSSGSFTSDAFGANIEWAFAKGAALFGRFGVGTLRDNVTGASYSPISWAAGFAFPNLFKKGALAGIGVGQPFTTTPGATATQTNVEAFYNYPVSDNITITPDIQFIFNPGNTTANTIFVGTLRTVFSF